MDTLNNEIIKPAFKFGKPNKSILLKKTGASLKVEDTIYEGYAEIRLDLLPRGKVYIYSTFQNLSPSLVLNIISKYKNISAFRLEGLDLPCFYVSFRSSIVINNPQKTSNITWVPRHEPINLGIANSKTITNIVFHIFNFKEIFGTRQSIAKKGNSRVVIMHFEMETKEWVIDLQSLSTTSDCFKTLKAEGGYGLTHIGSLRKKDRSSFSAKDASEILSAINYFLTFAKGIWCNPVCIVGFDKDGKRVWESFSSLGESWHSPFSWFDEIHSDQLAKLFPGFYAKWIDKDWQEAFRNVIYWYANANNSARGIDAGIILTQAGIERLSFEYSVRYKRLIEKGGFKDLKASDKFRILFSSLDLPIEIPDYLIKLKNLSSQFGWIDAPNALTEIRNSLVHPEHKQHGKFEESYFEAWNYGLWFLELALLRICGYSGKYRNRMKAEIIGQVEDVPWKS